jgi:acyl-CoA dehydrogenase
MTQNNHYRNDLLTSIFLSHDPKQPVDRMEYALQLILKNAELYKKLSEFKGCSVEELKTRLNEKVSAQELSQADMDLLITIEKARWDAMQVDEFTFDSMKKRIFTSVTEGLDQQFH